jgi:gliding motility-associated-like protein
MIYSIDGVAQNPVKGITQHPYQFQSAKGVHVYTLTSVSNSYGDGCVGNVSGTATVSVYTIPNGHNATFISPGTATLSVDDKNGIYDWYDAPVGGNLVYTGTTFITPVLIDTTTYYIEDKNATINCGRIPVIAFPVKPVVPLFIPNLITPNNDGKNDIFEIRGLPSNSSLKIVNRWGESIYSSENYNNLWKANEAMDGTYYYDLILPNGKSYKGWLSIVR